TTFHLDQVRDHVFEAVYEKGNRTTIQPLRIDVVSPTKYGARRLKGFVGVGDFVVSENDVYMFVQMSVTIPGSGGDQTGGRYLLRLGQSPMLFERLPDRANADDTQVRHIALGPDGHLYLMYFEKSGVAIYRR
ncbi:MAG TPA: hypothetical protein VKA30_02370, partial [Actinomycetota bacterium]|nr:hypothetical protein [Actinomycetota bacterium]